MNTYMTQGDPLTTTSVSDTPVAEYDEDPDEVLWIVADITSSFTVLLAIFFPSVTGK